MILSRPACQAAQKSFAQAAGIAARLYHDEERPAPLETSVPGIFAADDVPSGSVKRSAAAVGEGGMAVAGVHEALARPA
jgi:thioredoxin reductase (NADPH)